MPLPRRRLAVLALAFGLGALFGAGTGATLPAFSGTTSNAGNAFDAAPDWVPPTVISSVIAKSAGGAPGAIRVGGTYHVYANVTDGGNPPSGVATVTADVGSISSGQTAVPLVAGSYSVGGVAYNYRSGEVTGNVPLFPGTKSYAVTAGDNLGQSRKYAGFTVLVDNEAPGGTDVQAANASGGTAGQPEQGDTITLTFSEALDPYSVLSGWDGGAANVVVRIAQAGGKPAGDALTVWNATGSVQLDLGSVDLNGDYTSSTLTFGASGSPSVIVQSGAAITITLGTASATASTDNQAWMSWTPSGVATDPAGNGCSTASVSESGANDRDF